MTWHLCCLSLFLLFQWNNKPLTSMARRPEPNGRFTDNYKHSERARSERRNNDHSRGRAWVFTTVLCRCNCVRCNKNHCSSVNGGVFWSQWRRYVSTVVLSNRCCCFLNMEQKGSICHWHSVTWKSSVILDNSTVKCLLAYYIAYCPKRLKEQPCWRQVPISFIPMQLFFFSTVIALNISREREILSSRWQRRSLNLDFILEVELFHRCFSNFTIIHLCSSHWKILTVTLKGTSCLRPSWMRASHFLSSFVWRPFYRYGPCLQLPNWSEYQSGAFVDARIME